MGNLNYFVFLFALLTVLNLSETWASNPECPQGHFCTRSKYGIIEVVQCPGYTYHCSGVDWKSEYQVGIAFELLSPDGDRARDQMRNLFINGSHADDIDLTKKTISCGKETGMQEWSLKKEGRYTRFKLDSKCGTEIHSIEAVCQEYICTVPIPTK